MDNLRLPVWDNVFEHVEWTEAGRLVVVVTWCSLFYCSMSEHSCHLHRKLRLLILDLLLLWISNGNTWTSCDSEEEMDIGTGSEIRSACPGQEAGSFDGDDNHHHTLADWMWTPITVMPSKATDCGKSALTCEVSHVTEALLACLVLLCERKTMYFLIDKKKVT